LFSACKIPALITAAIVVNVDLLNLIFDDIEFSIIINSIITRI